MNNENKSDQTNELDSSSVNSSIHDFQFELICEYFSNIDRQGPGSVEVTRTALSFIENLTEKSLIADIGCGTGGQTITLAKYTKGNITAVDLFPKFIDLLKVRAEKEGYNERINAIVADMTSLPFSEEQFDMIWSEGAISHIGFEKGVNEWRKFIKPGGFIAVSEATWFTNERPKEIHDFWMDAYPEIDLISTKIAQMEKAGYKVIAHFILPESCWLDGYYAPQHTSRELFLQKYGKHQTALDFVANTQHEEALYNKYKEFYGYVFYIGKKF
ncbi:MAG: class I SAM-dependent methyltransferase [Fermentimonas sp.]|nr:class I SAM-dependent methyltransferase [Fermentimonas sp.]